MAILQSGIGRSVWVMLVLASISLVSIGLVSHEAYADVIASTISTGGNDTSDLAANPNTNTIYAVTIDHTTHTNEMLVINGATDSITRHIQDDNPDFLAVNPNTNKIYALVNYPGPMRVDVFDGISNNIIASVPVGNYDSEIAVNPVTNMLYVTSPGDNTVKVINGSTNSIISSIPVGTDPVSIGINPATNLVYVGIFGNGSPPSNTVVDIIDGSTNKVKGTVTVEQDPDQIASNPVTNKVYVANENRDISIIDGTTNAVVGTISQTYPLALAVNQVTNKIYSTDEITGLLYVYNGTTNKVLDTFSIGLAYDGSAVNSNTNKIYVGGSNIIVIDGSKSNPSSTPPPPTQATISVNSVDLCGNQLTGLWTIARYTNGSTATQGYTPASFQLQTGTTYVVHVGNYGSNIFSHWMNGNTTSYYTITLTQNAALTAYYSTGSTCTSPTSTAPGAPTGLAATGGNAQVSLSWTAPSDSGSSAITGYKIERSTDSGTAWGTIVSNTASTSTAYSDTGLAASTTYTYRVSAINAVGTSPPSNTASATTPASSTPPPTPTKVTISVNSVSLSGSPITGMWTVIRYTNGTTITSSYTPATFTVPSGTTYVVHVGNYGSNIFSHWQDGSTSSYFTLTLTQNVTLTAYYSG